MHFTWTAEQAALREKTIEFAQRELAPDLAELDREARFDRARWEKCGAQGIFRAHVPEAHGGLGYDARTTVGLLEALGYGSRDNGLLMAVGAQVWSVIEPILTFGSEAQKARYLPPIMSGEWIAADGITEASSGSDALALKTTATRTSGGYLLNGRKMFVGMAPIADVMLVLANADPNAGKWGVSAFMIEKGARGLIQGPPVNKLGTRTVLMGELVLEDCFVPEENRLGPEGIGISLFANTMDWERAFIQAGHMGAMDALIEDCIEHARSREQFGQAISGFQAVSHRIANMRLRQETARLLMYQAAAMMDAGEPCQLQCAMANLQISESLLESAMDAVRIFGARGYVESFGIAKDLRDHVGGVIYAGTSDIQRNLIARLIGL